MGNDSTDSMKILVTGRAIPQQPDRCTGQQLVDGFKQAGHEAVFYGCFYGQPYRFLGAKEVQTQDFDLVVVTEMNDGMPGYESLFNYYRLKNVPRLYWDFDVSYHPDVSFRRALAINYEAYLVGNSLFLEEFAFTTQKKVAHLPYACSVHIHRRKPEIVKESALGFIGSMTPERKAMLGNVRCFEGVFGEDLIDATNKLCTMVHVNQNACKGLVPGRPWETSGCGTTLLMDRASYEDFEEFLADDLKGTAVVPFDSAADIEAFRARFDNPGGFAELEEHGRRLMQFVHRNHSYRARAEFIAGWAKHEGWV